MNLSASLVEQAINFKRKIIGIIVWLNGVKRRLLHFFNHIAAGALRNLHLTMSFGHFSYQHKHSIRTELPAAHPK